VNVRIARTLAEPNRLKGPVRDWNLRDIVGQSAAIRARIAQARQYALCEATVLIVGETGTGKDVFARAIHYGSARAAKPFVPVNCGALPRELVENELFGHESEAFTGARGRHAGLVEQAERGTLFLDEIEALPLEAQATLLRFLQDGGYRPLGGGSKRRADVRIISASNAELLSIVGSGAFRQDLYYRLNVLPLNLPPLRERRDDVPLLVQHLLARWCGQGAPVPKVSFAAMRRLIAYHWPGNVRELENVIRRAVVLSGTKMIGEADLELSGIRIRANGDPCKSCPGRPLGVAGRPRKGTAEEMLAVLGDHPLGRQEWFERVQQSGLQISLRTFARRKAELDAAGRIISDSHGNSHRVANPGGDPSSPSSPAK